MEGERPKAGQRTPCHCFKWHDVKKEKAACDSDCQTKRHPVAFPTFLQRR